MSEKVLFIRSNIKKLISHKGSRYIIAGICTTLVNMILFSILTEVIKMDITISNIISVLVSILFAFFINKIYVFRAVSSNVKIVFYELVKFIGARMFTMVVEVGGVFLLANIIGQNAMFAKIEIQFIIVVLNYFISKWIVFK